MKPHPADDPWFNIGLSLVIVIFVLLVGLMYAVFGD